MSADHDFTMSTPALLKAAEQYHACATFHIAAGGSRHFCSSCGETELVHVLVAIRTAYRTVVQAVTASSDFPNENDWDEEHTRRPKLTSNERQDGMVAEGREDWLRDELEDR